MHSERNTGVGLAIGSTAGTNLPIERARLAKRRTIADSHGALTSLIARGGAGGVDRQTVQY